ncbi:acetylglutamate kinase [Candidatus Micrarchaeota archaeon CG08_land_8_20_14_0_20_49_17]|nr:MAG: acetylglutamate kinase [Candidatus Micrarchaeota archaeon CG08_land_8_20_14_0_20_49_17]PIZ98262.1 MAG: acetylglutamate kinase [Candidatus Micrarchaeota archaeon CG_4_10_14_0_2_um_filter_49_7]
MVHVATQMRMDLLVYKSHILAEAVPYIRKYRSKIMVIKIGGEAFTEGYIAKILQDAILLNELGIHPVIVHGGGKEITKEMERRKLVPRFIKGLRVSDAATIKVLKKVMPRTGAEITKLVGLLGGVSKQMPGHKGILEVQKVSEELGYVGQVTWVNTKSVLRLLKKGIIPVITPLGFKDGYVYNINADTAASSIAIALKAEKITFMTNVDGVKNGMELVPSLAIKEARKLIRKKIITGGMIPKTEACIFAVKNSCKKAHLVNGTIEHALLLEIFTDKGVGTQITKG